jgi:TetR/AcrR family transcriptional regulator, transcriptional repressor for nem operon
MSTDVAVKPETPIRQERPDTRTLLIEAGKDLMCEKGYTNTGLQEILARVGVPKGSFYHYFQSKEDFALDIIEHHNQFCGAKLERVLKDKDATPLTRLKNYCQEEKAELAARNIRKGCLIGNLSQEMADQSETLRTALSAVMATWRSRFADCISEGQALGEISRAWPAEKMAEMFLSAWGGAVTRAKSTKNLEPLEIFVELMFTHILKNHDCSCT